MAVVDICNKSGEKVSELDLAENVFNTEVKQSMLHEVVVMQLANKRSGTACVKNRSDVRGSTRKLYRQKGTGRARRGDKKAGLLRGGGVIFGPHPRSYSYRPPRKVRKAALAMALSDKVAENQLFVVDSLAMEKIKTKDAVLMLKALGLEKALLVTAEKETNLELSARNISRVKVLPVDGLNVYDILKYDGLVMEEAAVAGVTTRYAS